MNLAIFVLNQVELVDVLLQRLIKSGIRGGTMLDSMGIASYVAMKKVDDDLADMFRNLFSSGQHHNKTMLFCVDDEELDLLKRVIEQVTGGLGQPHSGILMVLPLSEVLGIANKKENI